jgi:DNA-binding NtrC family response regulator
MDIQQIKQRFGIIGQSRLLNNALEVASKVAPTDMNVLILGQSGVGKESFSKIIHHLSARKHAPFIAVNCGAIPEGTIDSELFGHEKGAYTGAHEKRKGYFEAVNGGTIFLDEVGELPQSTQARLLRVLENGEFIKVGSSQVQKTDVRVVAATNRDLLERAAEGKFREDLYYRLATVPIKVPRLAERREDIHMIFRKFAQDFADERFTQAISLSDDARHLLENYDWPGNVRQLKNITEQICVLEPGPMINAQIMANYLPKANNNLPVLLASSGFTTDGMSDRDILYKVLVDLKRDVSELKKVVFGLLEDQGGGISDNQKEEIYKSLVLEAENNVRTDYNDSSYERHEDNNYVAPVNEESDHDYIDVEVEEQEQKSLKLEDKEIELIQMALEKNKGRRKKAADDLGISERTLYRKIKQYDLE